jgi:hypothetical protein
MMRPPMRRVLILSWILLMSAVAAAQVPAKSAVALVLEVSGGRIAGVEPYREIPTGTTVTVPAGVRFVFQHYASCRRFVLTGGVATFRADGVDISGGARPSDTRVACPRKITLKDDGASAAVVMRSSGPPPITVSPRPEFVIVGPKASEISGLRVRRGSEVVVEGTFATERSFRWPQDTAPLAADTSYVLELVPLSATRAPLAIGLRVVEASGGSEALALISAE